MTPSTDDEWNWKHPMAYLVWQMNTELPLGLGVEELATKPGAGSQITGFG